MKFWDSSALFPLVAEDEHGIDAASIYASDPELTVWCLSPVEVWSAMTRRRREGVARSPEMRSAKACLDGLSRNWVEIQAFADVARIAKRLLETHPLRAADSLQLAAALFATDARADDLEFVTFDRRLAAAAEREGFRAVGATPAD